MTTIKLQNNKNEILIALEDNIVTKQWLDQLPSNVIFDSFGHKEKISYPKESFVLNGADHGHAAMAGDVVVYGPWGNIAIFLVDSKYSSDLIYLGKVVEGFEAVKAMKDRSEVHIEII